MILNQYIKEYNLKIKNNKNINDLNVVLKEEQKKDFENEKTNDSFLSIILYFILSSLFSYYFLADLHENNQYSDLFHFFFGFSIITFLISFISNKNIFQNIISAFFISFILIIPYSYLFTGFLFFPASFMFFRKKYIKKTKTKTIEENISLYHYKIEVNDNKMSSLISSISTDPDSLHFLENSKHRDFNNKVKKEIHNYLINNKKSKLVDSYIRQHSATSIYND